MMNIKEVLARNLKLNRVRLVLTQEKLAEKAEISTHYLAMLELAHKFPSADMLERLARALEIESHELFYMPSEAEKTLKELHQTIISDMRQIVSEAVEKITGKT